MADPVKIYMADGKYWQSLVAPSPAPAAISIGPWVFVTEGDHLRKVADPSTVPEPIYRGPVTYGGEDGVQDLPSQ